MKRYFVHYFLYSIWIAMIFLCTGCNKEFIVENTTPEHTFTFSLVSSRESSGENMTREPGQHQYNENRIEKTDIFFFDATGNLLYYPEQSRITYSADKLTLSIAKNDALRLFNKPLTLYVLANSKLSRVELAGKSLDQLQKLTQENDITFNSDTFTPQSSFLMEGMIELSDLDETTTNLGNVLLKRASAKIVITVIEAKVSGYTAIAIDARLNNYLDKTTLSEEAASYVAAASEYKNSGYYGIQLPNLSTVYSSDPLYSYANDWSNRSSKESYITLRVKWRHNVSGVDNYHYYRIPFDYFVSNEGGHANSALKRNHIYKFKVGINTLGGSDPGDMPELNPYFILKDWTTDEIIAELNQYEFLFVAEKNIEIHDISRRLIHYTSSKPVSISIDSVYYFEYVSSGTINKKNILPGTGFYPSIVADATTGNIVFDCNVPINYVPTHVVFTVTNKAQLAQRVKIVQYPRQYITSQYSDINDINFSDFSSVFWKNKGMGITGMKNFNFYTITTTALSPEDDFIIGGEMMGPSNSLQTGPIMATKKDAESNQMISPKFVIASQRGIYDPQSYTYSQQRCHEYAEGPYPKGTWRIPTVAEMALISKLQNDNNSAIKNLFVPQPDADRGRWWTAREDIENGVTYHYKYQVNEGKLERVQEIQFSPATAAIRCVHDVWKDE